MVRRVDHAAYFRRKSFAASAADELASLGYEVTIRRSYLRTALEFRRDSPVDHVSADKFTRQVVEVVSGQHGDYDGWGAGLER